MHYRLPDQLMYSKLGQEVNVILPETIPFLSELMEGMDCL